MSKRQMMSYLRRVSRLLMPGEDVDDMIDRILG